MDSAFLVTTGDAGVAEEPPKKRRSVTADLRFLLLPIARELHATTAALGAAMDQAVVCGICTAAEPRSCPVGGVGAAAVPNMAGTKDSSAMEPGCVDGGFCARNSCLEPK